MFLGCFSLLFRFFFVFLLFFFDFFVISIFNLFCFFCGVMGYTVIDADLKSKFLSDLRDVCVLKGFSKQTIKAYSFCVSRFLDFIVKSSLNLDVLGVKSYLLSLDLSLNSCRLHYAAVSFFFREVLHRPFSLEEVPIKKKPKGLPKVLSKEQIKLLIGATDNVKHKLLVKMLYSSGIRLQELIDLKRDCIDFDRNVIRVVRGKSNKDRITLLSDSI